MRTSDMPEFLIGLYCGPHTLFCAPGQRLGHDDDGADKIKKSLPFLGGGACGKMPEQRGSNDGEKLNIMFSPSSPKNSYPLNAWATISLASS